MTPEQQAMQDKREALREIEERASPEPPPRPRFGWAIGCLAAIVGAVAGVVAGWHIGSTFAPPPDPNAMIDLSGARCRARRNHRLLCWSDRGLAICTGSGR
jgi:hypothetical protein